MFCIRVLVRCDEGDDKNMWFFLIICALFFLCIVYPDEPVSKYIIGNAPTNVEINHEEVRAIFFLVLSVYFEICGFIYVFHVFSLHTPEIHKILKLTLGTTVLYVCFSVTPYSILPICVFVPIITLIIHICFKITEVLHHMKAILEAKETAEKEEI